MRTFLIRLIEDPQRVRVVRAYTLREALGIAATYWGVSIVDVEHVL